jgi:hypothetical protein
MAPKARMNLVVDAELEEKFRNAVFKSKGMKKGNISEAMEEAIELWILEQLKTAPEQKAKSK